MSADLTIRVDVTGLVDAVSAVQAQRNALANRQPMHAQMAMDIRKFTRAYLAADDRHASARKLGAVPTGFRAKIASEQGGIEADSDNASAIMRIPRNTGLGRAFRAVDISWNGVKRMVRPACAATYGKSPRDFPEDAFKYGLVQGRFPALLWRADDTPAFFLMKKYHQDQDRTLLPSDEDLTAMAELSALTYLRELQPTTNAA